MGRLWGRTQNNSRISTEWGHDGRKNEEYQRLLIDELTDQSERLAAPMQNKFFYHLDRAGRLVSEFGDEIIPVLERGLQAAVVEARNRPDITFEVERRALELDETRLLEALARGEVDKTTLVVVSPIPDAVRFGSTTIDGYDRERMKTMVRIAHKTESGVSIESLSLDQSNYKALQEMVRAVGHTLPDGLSSEQILARRYWLDLQPNSQQELTEFLRSSYDASLTRQIGGRWFAGRIFASQTDALSFIKSQPNLITEHMNTVMSILAKEPDARTRTRILEEARYNFAAALDDLLNGRLVASLMDAGDIARSLGRTFNRECATLGTEDQLIAQGYMQQEWKHGRCQACFVDTLVGGCSICVQCANAHENGGDEALEAISREARRRMAARDNTPSYKMADIEQSSSIRRRGIGQFALHTRIVIGGAKHIAIHSLTGQELSEDETRDKFELAA